MAVTQALPKDLLALLPNKPAHVDNVTLTGGGAAVAYTIPTGMSSCLFSPYPLGTNFLVNPNGTAVKPTANVTNGGASIPNPIGLRGLTPGDVLSFIAGTVDVHVTIIGAREPGGPA